MSPPTICARTDRPVNAYKSASLPLTVFAQNNFVADFLRDTEREPAKKGYFAFLDPLWGLEAGFTFILLESA